jgi:hypothetical protein
MACEYKSEHELSGASNTSASAADEDPEDSGTWATLPESPVAPISQSTATRKKTTTTTQGKTNSNAQPDFNRACDFAEKKNLATKTIRSVLDIAKSCQFDSAAFASKITSGDVTASEQTSLENLIGPLDYLVENIDKRVQQKVDEFVGSGAVELAESADKLRATIRWACSLGSVINWQVETDCPPGSICALTGLPTAKSVTLGFLLDVDQAWNDWGCAETCTNYSETALLRPELSTWCKQCYAATENGSLHMFVDDPPMVSYVAVSNDTKCLSRSNWIAEEVVRPLWFVVPHVSAAMAGMLAQLLEVSAFRKFHSDLWTNEHAKKSDASAALSKSLRPKMRHWLRGAWGETCSEPPAKRTKLTAKAPNEALAKLVYKGAPQFKPYEHARAPKDQQT